MVHLRELLGEEELGKPCERKEKHARQLDLDIHNSNIEEKTGQKLVRPGGENGIDTNNRMNASYLNSESYTGEQKVIVTVGWLRKLFLSLIKMEQDEEAIAEEEAETRSDDIKHCYRVHQEEHCRTDSL